MNTLNQNQNTVLNQTSEVPNVITQRNAHKSRSARYSVVTTEDVLKMFEAEGFTWRLVAQEKSRKQEYKGFGTHLIALEHPALKFDDEGLAMEISPMIYLKNSYHGRSRLVLDFGIFRFYCMNGCMLGNLIERLTLIHRNLNQAKIKETVDKMKDTYKNQVAPFILSLKERQLTPEQQLEFARLALAKRMESNPGYLHGEHAKLLAVNRPEDEGNSLWIVLQRVQENLGLNFRGIPVDISYSYLSKDKDGNEVVKTRKVQKTANIQAVTEMNKWLFDTAKDILAQ